MAGSTFGKILTMTTWGESHGAGIGVVVDGCPAGLLLAEEDIQKYLDRRKPGQSRYTTKRNESDSVEIMSGVFEGRTTGTPIAMMIRNQDQHSKDYSEIAGYYRPGHADYTFDKKYGFRDYRGGGRSSGRETIGRVAAGAVAAKILEAVSYTHLRAHETSQDLVCRLLRRCNRRSRFKSSPKHNLCSVADSSQDASGMVCPLADPAIRRNTKCVII